MYVPRSTALCNQKLSGFNDTVNRQAIIYAQVLRNSLTHRLFLQSLRCCVLRKQLLGHEAQSGGATLLWHHQDFTCAGGELTHTTYVLSQMTSPYGSCVGWRNRQYRSVLSLYAMFVRGMNISMKFLRNWSASREKGVSASVFLAT